MLVDIKSRMLQLQKKALGDADADAAIDEEFALEKLDKESKYYFITANLPELSTQKPGEIGGEDPS